MKHWIKNKNKRINRIGFQYFEKIYLTIIYYKQRDHKGV